MKRLATKLAMIAILMCSIGFSSCLTYAFSKAAEAGVTVYDPSGNPVANEIVYMYKATLWSPGSKKDDYVQKLATNSNGYVEFKVKEIEMGPGDDDDLFADEAYFYFVTYTADDRINGYTKLLVESSDYVSGKIYNKYK